MEETHIVDTTNKALVKRILKNFLLFILLCIIGFASYTIFKYIQSNITSESPILESEEKVESFSYGAKFSENQNLYLEVLENSTGGVIAYDRIQIVDGEPTLVTVNLFDVVGNSVETYVETGLHSGLVPDSKYAGTVLEYNDETDQMNPSVFDTVSGKFTKYSIPANHSSGLFFTSPAEGWYAGSVHDQSSADDENQRDITYESVVLYHPETDVVRIIRGATSPQWISNGRHLLYLKAGGMYRYSLADETEELIFDHYTTLLSSTELAVSRDGQFAAMTMPTIDAISFIKILEEGSTTRELGRVQELGREFRNPVFSQDGQFVAVLRRSEGATVGVSDNIEIYSPLFIEPVKSMDLSDGVTALRALTAWTSFTPEILVME